MAKSTYTTDPIVFFKNAEEAVQIMETVRGLADPRLTIIVEGDSDHEVWHRVAELNDELRFLNFQIPLPEVCPTCGRDTDGLHPEDVPGASE